MKRIVALWVCGVFCLNAQTKIYYIAKANEDGEVRPPLGQDFQLPFYAVFETETGNPESTIVYEEDFENLTNDNNATSGDRIILRHLDVNPTNGELIIGGVEAPMRWTESFSFTQMFALLDGGTLGVPFSTGDQLGAQPGSEANRKLRLWSYRDGEFSETLTATIPAPENLPYTGPPFPSPDVPLTITRPELLIDGLDYSFSSEQAFIPLFGKIYRFEDGEPAMDLTPGSDFFTMTDAFGGSDFLGGGSVAQYGKTLIDDVRGTRYHTHGAREVEVVTFEEAFIFDAPSTVNNPHLIRPAKLRIHTPQSFRRISRFDLNGERPLVFEQDTTSGVLEMMALDAAAGLFFAYDSFNQTLLKKSINRPDSSVQAFNSGAVTGNSDYQWESLASNVGSVVAMQTEPAEQKLYYLLNDGRLMTIDYVGTTVLQAAQLPDSALEFAVHHTPAVAAPATATFQLITPLPRGDGRSFANDITADGSIILAGGEGAIEDVLNPVASLESQSFLTTVTGQPGSLGFIPNSRFLDPVKLSGNGSAAILSHNSLSTGLNRIVWSAKNGLQTTDELGASFLDEAHDLNFDGSVIVGTKNQLPALWTKENGVVFAQDSGNSLLDGTLLAVNAAGNQAVGRWQSASNNNFAFSWKVGDQVILLTTPDETYFSSEATAVSASGKWIAGNSLKDVGDNVTLNTAFISNEGNEFVDIGSLAPGEGFADLTNATGVSDTGVVVGDSAFQASLYHQFSGLLSLKDTLENVYGLDLTDINLQTANAITPDGKTIVGTAFANGNRTGFVATLPNFPADAILATSGLSDLNDADADGLSDFFEGVTGSDPYNASSTNATPLIITLGENSRELSFLKPAVAVSSGVTYAIERAPNLEGPWTTDGITTVTDDGSEIRVTVPNGSSDFFRLRAVKIAD